MDEIPEYQAPSDNKKALIEQVQDYWLSLINGHGYPGQEPYLNRLVELVVKAAEHGWLADGSSGLTAANISDSLMAMHPQVLDGPDTEERLHQISSRWEIWAELFSVALPEQLIKFP